MQKQKVMRRMRILLLAGFAAIALGATSASAGVHVYLPPIPLPSVVFSAPPVVVGVHPVPPPPVYYAPPTRYRYVDHHYYERYERPRHHHKHQYDRRRHKHHRGCDH